MKIIKVKGICGDLIFNLDEFISCYDDIEDDRKSSLRLKDKEVYNLAITAEEFYKIILEAKKDGE